MVSVCQPLGLPQHLRHEIETVNVGHSRCESAAQVCRTAGNIEHNLRAVRGEGVNDPSQSLGGKSGLGERPRLPTKLRADTIVMARNGHEQNVAPARPDDADHQGARTRTAAAPSAALILMKAFRDEPARVSVAVMHRGFQRLGPSAGGGAEWVLVAAARATWWFSASRRLQIRAARPSRHGPADRTSLRSMWGATRLSADLETRAPRQTHELRPR
jgi:hypothetical protein